MSIVNFLAALVLVYILWSFLIKKRMKNLTCRRTFSKDRAFEGEEGEMIEVVRNDGPAIFPWVRVESYISPNLQLGRQENLAVSSNAFYRSCFSLMPYQQIKRRHQVRFLRRGVYDLGNASMAAGDLFGVTRFWKDQQLSTRMIVYPRLLELSEIPLPLSKTLGDMICRSRLLADPFLVRGIRPYQPGDLIRDIHWQATARTEELQVRVHDHTICTRLLVVLNAQRSEDQWDDYVREADAPLLEEEIRLAASICIHALREGLSVGFAANMPQEHQGKSTLILPGEGPVWEERILDGVAGLQMHCSEKFLPLLEGLAQYEDMDILVLSSYDSPDIQARLDHLRERGNQVIFRQWKGGQP